MRAVDTSVLQAGTRYPPLKRTADSVATLPPGKTTDQQHHSPQPQAFLSRPIRQQHECDTKVREDDNQNGFKRQNVRKCLSTDRLSRDKHLANNSEEAR